MKTYFLEVEDDRIFDVAIQKVLYCIIMHTLEDLINVLVLYDIPIKYEVRLIVKSQKINKTLTKTCTNSQRRPY